MYITYHKQLEKPKEITAFIPHKCLHKDIQDFIEKNKCKQNGYYIDNNQFYMFIYLDNKDRIDVYIK